MRDTQPELDDVAAAVVAAAPSPLPSARGFVELLWWAPDAVEQVRKVAAWRALENSQDGDASSQQRALLLSILKQSEATELAELRQRMLRVAQSISGFVAPRARLNGDLLFQYEPLEVLKATATVLAPQALGDEKLSAAMKGVSDLLSASWLQSADAAARALTARLRAAAPMDDPTVDEQVRRVLMGQRAYAKRDLFGQTHIVAHFVPAGLRERVPCYIPWEHARALPMYEQLTARVVVEAHLRQDQFETHDIALRIVVLGRLVDLGAIG